MIEWRYRNNRFAKELLLKWREQRGLALHAVDLKKVVQVAVPAENLWFQVPVTLIRWKVLAE